MLYLIQSITNVYDYIENIEIERKLKFILQLVMRYENN